MNPERMPSELRALDQWVCYRTVERKGKLTKVPYQPNGLKADVTNPKTWGSFAAVSATKGYDGVGFVLTDEAGYIGIDLDKCRDPQMGEPESWARAIIEEMDSYTELSQSGRGYHVIVKGELLAGANRRGRVEMYSHVRFFVMTGEVQFGRAVIKHRSVADLQRRMVASQLDPAQRTNGKWPRTDDSAEDYRLIVEIQREVGSNSADVLEAEFRKRYPERYAARNREKGQRGEKNYIRYTIDRLLAKDAVRLSADPGPYRIDAGRICIRKNTNQGVILNPLCNFVAQISEEIVLDDGAETARAFILSGTLSSGEHLPPARVPASRFGGMSWVADHWGVGAVVNAGFSTRDQLREAIQRLSPDPRRRRIFTHTGWREIDGEWMYLTARGAVGHDGFEVDLGPGLSKFSLPRLPEDQREAMQISLRLLDVAPLTVTAPLFAAIYRAPLASACPLDLSLWIEGPTGSLKSTIAALFESHYGAFSETSLPGSWSSTANQLERRAFVLKDLPFIIDDYAPSGIDARELEMKAARLLRSQGNLSGRGRLRADLSERAAYPPRGIIIGTGEQHPAGQSILARTPLVELDRADVDLSALTIAQRNALRLPHAMAGYLLWLAPQMATFPQILRETYEGARHRATAGGEHLRVPGALAHLWIGIDCAMRYAVEVGAIDDVGAADLRTRCWNALEKLGDRQALSVEGERPSRRFLGVLATLLAQGRIVLIDKNSRPSTSNGNASIVGWEDEEFLYLIPDAAYQSVARFCRDSGELFPVRSERLLRDLNKEGLSDCSEGRNTATINLGGQKRRVIRIKRDQAEALIGESLPSSYSFTGTSRTTGTASGE